MAKRPTLASSAGAAIGEDQNSVTEGPRGTMLLQDSQLLEKLAHQSREGIPVQSRTETWRDTVMLTGGVIAIVAICASVLVGFHARHHSIHANTPAVSDTGGATPHSG